MARGGFRKVGNWVGVGRLVDNLGRDLYRAQQRTLKRWGLKAERIAKEHIADQDLPWVPLSPRHLSNKIAGGYSENTYVMTSSYFQSITSFVRVDTAYAGILRGQRNTFGDDLGAIARNLEYGNPDTNLPPRPLWKPTFAETMRWQATHNTVRQNLAAIIGKRSP